MDIFANVPSASEKKEETPAGGNTNFDDIFAGSSQPLASGNQDNNQVLGSFYTQQNQPAQQPNIPMDNQFATAFAGGQQQ